MSFSKNGLLEVPNGAVVMPLADPVTVGFQKHVRAKDALFPHVPNMNDVRQGEIGDCYLLAGINAVLAKPDGPEIIQCLMKDNLDGTFTIRFYKEDRFQYFRMSKSIVRQYKGKFLGVHYGTEKVLHNQTDALWVSMIEKAYAACMRGVSRTYSGLEGGEGAAAAVALVGWGASQNAVGHATEDESSDGLAFSALLNEVSPRNPISRIPKLRQLVLASVARIFPDDGEACTNATRWFEWSTAAKFEELIKFQNSHPTHDKWRKLLDTIGTDLHPETRALVTIWVQNRKLWPGEVGTHDYLRQQLDLFAKIQRLLATQRSVVASTHNTLVGRQTGVGGSAGEAKVDGLAAKHEYTVLDTKIETTGLRFVRVRNPWGEGGYGKTYHRVQVGIPAPGKQPILKMSPVETTEAESWIELTDFTRNFTVKFGSAVHGAARHQLMNGLDQQLQAQKANLKPVPKKTT